MRVSIYALFLLLIALVVRCTKDDKPLTPAPLTPLPLGEDYDNEVQQYSEFGKDHGWTFNVKGHPILKQRVEYVTGLKIPSDWQTRGHFEELKRTSLLPTTFDWREKGIVPPVKNQGQCGSCWAFGTVGVLESLYKRKTGNFLGLSEQQLISCNLSANGCNGGFMAFDFEMNPGATGSKDFPYQAAEVGCPEKLPMRAEVADWSYIGSPEGKPTTAQLKHALMEYGPLATVLTVTRPLMAYSKGVFNSCTGGKVNHMVILEGWNDSTNSWIVRNSWGETWGENGYLRIKFGCNNIGSIAAFATLK